MLRLLYKYLCELLIVDYKCVSMSLVRYFKDNECVIVSLTGLTKLHVQNVAG